MQGKGTRRLPSSEGMPFNLVQSEIQLRDIACCPGQLLLPCLPRYMHRSTSLTQHLRLLSSSAARLLRARSAHFTRRAMATSSTSPRVNPNSEERFGWAISDKIVPEIAKAVDVWTVFSPASGESPQSGETCRNGWELKCGRGRRVCAKGLAQPWTGLYELATTAVPSRSSGQRA